ncbi:hypothetical protein H6F98_21025 [Microcoleus sp. FACHB-SPT15]|uniref:hypothetical protein n=1 Tax=Microcoleus sp. FACHB-SPT15 TaxID=2692830 RepID=UPI00178709FF|nr:hypothetical protein [Microcoleus sp. FACHB-SPT15]MBD1807915.1 hypothetical protein [Microcoleus sp. FACHB-SPT15]
MCEPDNSLERVAIAPLAAESTCWHRLRYGKSQTEFRVGIEECDRASIAVSR